MRSDSRPGDLRYSDLAFGPAFEAKAIRTERSAGNDQVSGWQAGIGGVISPSTASHHGDWFLVLHPQDILITIGRIDRYRGFFEFFNGG